MALVAISEYRLKSLLAAEALAQNLRKSVAAHGGMTRETMAYLDQWMRRSGSEKYEHPKPTHPVYCPQCLKRHVYGKCAETP